MKIKLGYKEWNTWDWGITVDLGARKLECPDCGCGIFIDDYNRACGTDALNFCPYCGKQRRPEVKRDEA